MSTLNLDQLKLDRRSTLAMGGVAALSLTGMRISGAVAQDEPEQCDFPLCLGLIETGVPHYYAQNARFFFDPDARRKSVVMGIDTMPTDPGYWIGGGEFTLIRPNQGGDITLAWDRIAYCNIDQFTRNSEASDFIQAGRATMDAYNPIDQIVPDGLPSDSFVSTVQFPFQSDPSIQINRTICGTRRGNTSALFTFDNYGTSVPDPELIDLVRQFTDTFRNSFSTEPTVTGPPLLGGPAQADFGFRVFDSQFFEKYEEVIEPDPASQELRVALNDGALIAASANWAGTNDTTGSPNLYFYNVWQFPDEALAMNHALNIYTKLAPIDAASGTVRVPFTSPVPVAGNVGVFTDRFLIDIPPDQQYLGQQTIIHSGETVAALSEVDPRSVYGRPTPTPDDSAIYIITDSHLQALLAESQSEAFRFAPLFMGGYPEQD